MPLPVLVHVVAVGICVEKIDFCSHRWKADARVVGFWRDGIQQRHNSWQDGVLGTTCEIPSRWNWTYKFQVKDQVGSFFYYPSTRLQRSAGGYGGIRIKNVPKVPPPFAPPAMDRFVLIGDWYTRSHKVPAASSLLQLRLSNHEHQCSIAWIVSYGCIRGSLQFCFLRWNPDQLNVSFQHLMALLGNPFRVLNNHLHLIETICWRN